MKKLLPLLALLSVSPCLAATITFQAGADGYDHLGIDIRQNGSASITEILVGYQSGPTNNHEMRGLLSFSLSTIPAGSTINSITLTMTSNGSQAGDLAGVGTINLHEIRPQGVASNNFTEAGANWTKWGSAETATWTTPGGDYLSTALAAAVLNSASGTTLAGGETATFNTSVDFVAAAQAAFNAGLPLEMIMLAPTAEANTTAANFIRFRSDDNTSAGTRPLLTINYTIPEPTSALMVLLAGVPLVARRRR